jgi:hypothetical protein
VGGNSAQLPQYGSIRESGDQLGDFIFSRSGAPVAANVGGASASTDPDPGRAGVIPVSDSDNGGTSKPSLDTDVPFTPFDNQAEQAAITGILHKYEDARSRRDAAALWLVWPRAPSEQKALIESYFKTASSIHTQLKLDPADFSSDHLTATVNGRMLEKCVFKAGQSPPERDDPITFILKKSGDAWTISDVR